MKSATFILTTTLLLQGCCNLFVSKEETYNVEKKECLAEGGDYIKFGSDIFDYQCAFDVIPLSTIAEEGRHEARRKECHDKGGQYVNFTNEELGYDCLDIVAPKKTSPNKKVN